MKDDGLRPVLIQRWALAALLLSLAAGCGVERPEIGRLTAALDRHGNGGQPCSPHGGLYSSSVQYDATTEQVVAFTFSAANLVTVYRQLQLPQSLWIPSGRRDLTDIVGFCNPHSGEIEAMVTLVDDKGVHRLMHLASADNWKTLSASTLLPFIGRRPVIAYNPAVERLELYAINSGGALLRAVFDPDGGWDDVIHSPHGEALVSRPYPLHLEQPDGSSKTLVYGRAADGALLHYLVAGGAIASVQQQQSAKLAAGPVAVTSERAELWARTEDGQRLVRFAVTAAGPQL